MKILLTGGAGYIGSVLVPSLLGEGWTVTVVDSFNYDQNSLAMSMIDPKLTLVKEDIRNHEAISKLISRHDVVIPLAAIVGAPACNRNPKAAFEVNNVAQKKIIDACESNQFIVMPTTNSAYGTTEGKSFVDETAELNPISTYATDKVEVEEHLQKHSNFVSFRLATVFGMSPRMRTDLLVNDMVLRAILDKSVVLFEGHFIRNYVHVRDVCAAILWALKNNEKVKNNVYNVGLEEANLSKIELCEEIQKFIPEFTWVESLSGEDPDKRNYRVSNRKILDAGFTFNVSLHEGIQELLKGLPTLSHRNFTNL